MAEQPASANRLRLASGMTGAEALAQIARACLAQIAANETAVLAGSPRGVHQMRVGTRRLRAVLSAFGRALPEHERRPIEAELRWLGAVLGEARNLDVLQATLSEAAARDEDRAAALAPLFQGLESRARRAYGELRYAIHSPRFRALTADLQHWAEALADDRAGAAKLMVPIGELAPAILDHRRHAVKKRGKGFAHQSPARRHRLRIALKKLRYASDSLGDLYDPDDVGRFLHRLKALQDGLGDAHDVIVGRQVVTELPRSAGLPVAKAVLQEQERHLAARDRDMRKHLDRLLDLSPFWRT